MSFRTLLTLTLASAPLWGEQAGSLYGPNSGYVFDEPSRSLRVINGVPGAAYLGPAIATDLDFATVSPDGTLAVTLHDGQLALLRLESGETTALGMSERIARAAWSGDSVALSGANLAIFRKLKSKPESVGLAGLGTRIRAIASDGESVFAAAEDGIYLLNSSGARLIAPLEDPTAVALQGDTLYAASKARQQVFTIRHWTESAEIATLASGFEDPEALALNRDGSVLFVADGASRSLVSLNALTGERLGSLELDFEPSRADRLSSGLLLLNSRAKAMDPVQVLDTAQRAVFFIPAQDLSSSPVSVED